MPRALRTLVPLTGDRLASRAAKHLTMAKEYQARRAFAKAMEKPPANVAPSWFHPTRQRPPEPFETSGCLPGMERHYAAARAGLDHLPPPDSPFWAPHHQPTED